MKNDSTGHDPECRNTLFPRLLGEAFRALPETVRRIHQKVGAAQYHGAVSVRRGRNLIARLCCWATSLPPAGDRPIRVDIEAAPDDETWVRRVGSHAMRSRLWRDGGWLCERLGLVRFRFRIAVESDVLVWHVAQVHALGILPLPAAWFGEVLAREFEQAGRYHFDVVARLPVVGLLVHYRGWLEVD